jgi:two-component system, NtrC family, sensor kinase
MMPLVLIVDDSLTVRMDLAEAFDSAGYRTVSCATAAEARAALARGPISLVVLDVVLPDADGTEILREIRTGATPDLRVLMLSSEAEVKDRIRALQIGADDYVGKPYDLGFVVARARELLADQTSPPIATATILVIDDSPTFREELRSALEGAGYAVLLASSGEEGLRMAAGSRPSAILVDGVLPGVDGATVIRKIRLDAALRDTPCMLLTGADDRGSELRALEAGADAFVRKGEDLDIVLVRLAAVLRAATGERVDTASLFGPKRILAVDDSPTFLHELAGMLRGEGHDVVLARSGEEAIEMLAVQPVDCILLDLIMPGMGGKAACRHIKESPVLCDVPLIMLTSLDDREAVIEGLSQGADDYVSKASEFAVLNVRIRAQMRRKQFEAEQRRTREELFRTELRAMEERAAREVAETSAALVGELERKNKELETFSYSVSHDLRAPLRAIDGFSHALLEEYGGKLDEQGRDYLQRVRAGTQRMGELIEDLLKLSRVSGSDLHRKPVDLSEMARRVCEELQSREPGRRVTFAIEPELVAVADAQLMRLVFENLLGNAWKFTGKVRAPRIEVGAETREVGVVYFVRDNGAGFDMAYADTLFAPFRRLHRDSDFPGTGIGLATVYRVIDRHGGRVWAEGVVGGGATVFFTVPPPRVRSSAGGVR